MEGDAQSWRSRRPQGRTRRQKRSRGGANNNQCIDQNKRSTFRFDVEIPNYYNVSSETTNISAVEQTVDHVTEEGSHSTGDSGNEVHDSTKNASQTTVKDAAGDERESKEDHQPKVPLSTSEHGHDMATPEKDPKPKMHNQFIAALEKHGSSAGAWHAIASEMKWKIDDVKVYAYSYFKALVRDRNMKNHDGLIENGGQKETSNSKMSSTSDGKNQQSWSFHELVLLDSLMVKYCKDLSCLDVKQRSEHDESSCLIRQRSVWEKVASQFPGKTAHACKKEGIARLLRVYEERE
mmetsp:Transcript_24226/g.52256  ORF Transcript_24226/g.52256 Transcript_24226/m.52256 type:complete len:293 (+) Transcript_24226:187-1065(+)|eukprot:CAMPEP_0172315958 /NCGR_PEP_ID=MMETSP1058-20130122/26789_1 /TAXON_ID=83371 /ORGANISM="Detonula confervacea, Strain CCMP 353" /LENGTH=292 /DNA_ID=CAMNT_0013030165 /DNA_START=109 /DNA_END=987 /DNA_ORIENTATION=+